MDQLQTFIEKQIKIYHKVNHLEILLGKQQSDNIFKTIYQDNNECEFAKLIKHFRNFKLSYSQGKRYQYLNHQLKTFNNKYTEIHKTTLLEKEIIHLSKYDMLVQNNNLEVLQEFPLKKEYNEEVEYDEVNIHLSKDSNEQLLIFQKKGDYHLLKLVLKIDVNLPYMLLDELMKDIKRVLKILEDNGLTFS